jgi:hypothetical protein
LFQETTDVYQLHPSWDWINGWSDETNIRHCFVMETGGVFTRYEKVPLKKTSSK